MGYVIYERLEMIITALAVLLLSIYSICMATLSPGELW